MSRPARIAEVTHGITGEHVGWMFRCPGCDSHHQIAESAGWTFDGDTEHPTVGGSVLVFSHRTLIDNTLEGDALTAESNLTDTPQCHSFITAGRIEYLSDTTHALSGKTVELPLL